MLKLGFDEVKKRQTEMDEEVKKEAEEITAHHKLRLTKEYCNKLESMKNSLEETKRLWLSEHNMQMILLGVLAIYSFAITFFHGLIWNPGFYEDVNDCVKGIVGTIKKIALWIWNLSGFVAEISDKISSDTASNITNILIRAAIIIGILIFIYVIIKNLGSLLLEHWKRIRMWDRTTLIIAFFLTGTAAIVPEMEINVAATMIGAFICYIVIRSFICMENKDIRNTIIKIIAYLMISAGCFLGFVLFLRWIFSG